MSMVPSVGSVYRSRVEPASDESRRVAMRDGARPAGRDSDTLEVSKLATYLSKLNEAPAARQALVARVREQIIQGVYDTPEKLEAALDRMIDEA